MPIAIPASRAAAWAAATWSATSHWTQAWNSACTARSPLPTAFRTAADRGSRSRAGHSR